MTHPRLTPARDYLLGLMAEVYPTTPAISFGSSPDPHKTIPEKAQTISYQGPRSGHRFLVMAHDLDDGVHMDFITTTAPLSATSALTGDRDTDLQIIQLLREVQDTLDKANLR